MSGRYVAAVLLIALVVTIVGAAGAAVSAPPRHTIRVDRIGVTFDVPRGFVALQSDVTEGSWATIISFAQELGPGHLTAVPVRLVFWPSGFDGTHAVPEYTPSEYVEAEFRRAKESVQQQRGGYVGGPEYVRLFGNRAVRYSFTSLEDHTIVIGYLRVEQLPPILREAGHQYLVRIEVESDQTAKEVFDSVIGSLRATRSSALRMGRLPRGSTSR